MLLSPPVRRARRSPSEAVNDASHRGSHVRLEGRVIGAKAACPPSKYGATRSDSDGGAGVGTPCTTSHMPKPHVATSATSAGVTAGPSTRWEGARSSS